MWKKLMTGETAISCYAFISNSEWSVSLCAEIPSFPPVWSGWRSGVDFLPCNHFILAKSKENLTVWYLTPWLVHSITHMLTHAHTKKLCTLNEKKKGEVAHQVITKNTHSAISLLPDFQGTQRRGEWLEKLCWEDGGGATKKKKKTFSPRPKNLQCLRLMYRFCAHGNCFDKCWRPGLSQHFTTAVYADQLTEMF